MKPRRVVGILVCALVVYFIFIGYRGFYLLSQPQLALKVFGVAVLALPLVGAWVVVAELRFGVATQILAERLNAEEVAAAVEGDPADETGPAEQVADLPRRPSGRVDRAAADEYFSQRRLEVEEHPDEWQRWYRLAEAYDVAGDRKRAREAMRAAISHAQHEPGGLAGGRPAASA